MFDFMHCKRYAALPRREKRWHLILVCVLLCVALLSCRVPTYLYGRFGYRGETVNTAAIAALSEQTQVLFVGSSHILMGIRPSQFKMPVMNLTTVGMNYACAESLLRKQWPRVPRVKAVVIEYDECPLIFDTVTIWESDLRPFLELGLGPLDIPATTMGQRCRLLRNSFLYPILTLPRVTPRAQAAWQQGTTDAYSQVQHPKQGFAAGYVYREKAIARPYTKQSTFGVLTRVAQDEEVAQYNLRALGETLNFLEKRGVKVVLFRLPHHAYYRTNQPAILRRRWQQLQSFVRERQATTPNLICWDWDDRPEFQDSDFYDDNHLNVSGANKLARLLDARLRPLCRGTEPATP